MPRSIAGNRPVQASRGRPGPTRQVRRAALANREPSLENGELTPSGKLIRKTVLRNFDRKINALFDPQASGEVIEVQQESQRMVAHER